MIRKYFQVHVVMWDRPSEFFISCLLDFDRVVSSIRSFSAPRKNLTMTRFLRLPIRSVSLRSFEAPSKSTTSFSFQMASAMKNQTRFSSSAGVKPLTTLTDDELMMKQTGKSSSTYITNNPSPCLFTKSSLR